MTRPPRSNAPDAVVEARRAQFYLNRRLNARRRKAGGLPVDCNFGGVREHHIPSRKTIEAGVEGRRAQSVKVTLPVLNLPELGDD